MITSVLFDLDGTLTDPGEGITNAIAYALARFGISVADRRELYSFIGPSLVDAFCEKYGFSRAEGEAALGYYREYYGERGMYEATLYPGVAEMLASLKAAGKRVLLATSKPEFYAAPILAHFGVAGYFDFVGGATMDESRVKKADVIAYALSSCAIDPAEAVMVGDRKHDILGARSVGIPAIGVSYGYGSVEELREAGASHIAASPEEVVRMVGDE